MQTAFTQAKIQAARGLVAQGWQLEIEHEMTITRNFEAAPTGWWDDNAWLRARADAIIIPPNPTVEPVMLVDIKTGRVYDRSGFQLRTEALLAHCIYKTPIVMWSYWYVDQGECVSDTIDFRQGIEKCRDILESIKNMQFAIDNNYFPATRNKFCKWCGLYNTPSCGV